MPEFNRITGALRTEHTTVLKRVGVCSDEALVGYASRPSGLQDLERLLGVTRGLLESVLSECLDGTPFDVDHIPSTTHRSFGLQIRERVADATVDGTGCGLFARLSELPARADLSNKITVMHDQGDRPTCVACSTASMIEYQLRSGEALSAQHLYYGCKQRDGWDEEGTTFEAAAETLEEDGVCLEEHWPYNPNPIPGDEGQGPPPSDAVADAAGRRVDSDAHIVGYLSVEEVKTRLAGADGNDPCPVVLGIHCFPSMMNPHTEKTGHVFEAAEWEASLGAHAVCVVAFEDDDEAPGGGWLYFKNSWGEDWGRKNKLGPGHGRVSYQYALLHMTGAMAVWHISEERPDVQEELKCVAAAPKTRWVAAAALVVLVGLVTVGMLKGIPETRSSFGQELMDPSEIVQKEIPDPNNFETKLVSKEAPLTVSLATIPIWQSRRVSWEVPADSDAFQEHIKRAGARVVYVGADGQVKSDRTERQGHSSRLDGIPITEEAALSLIRTYPGYTPILIYPDEAWAHINDRLAAIHKNLVVHCLEDGSIRFCE